MPEVSIIIPFNNVENYIEQCLNTVISQTLKDIEIILNSLTEEDLTLDTKSLLNIIKNKNFNNISYLSKFIINHG